MNKSPIYLDYCATTPCDPEVVESMLPYFLDTYGNPMSKDHFYGWKAREAVDEARERVASLIGASAGQVVFTSGATESINLAIKGLVNAQEEKKHLITCATEHKAVLNTCAALEKEGIEVTCLEVDRRGRVSLEQLESAIKESTMGIVLMFANNETGVIHPVNEIGAIAEKHGLTFICDATQAVGKVRVNVEDMGVDLMAFSSHKMYGPKGVGGLYIKNREATGLVPQIHGGKQEWGLRSGTLNVPGIVGLGKAAEIGSQKLEEELLEVTQLRDSMEATLKKAIPDLIINGDKNRLPHVISLSLPFGNAEDILLSLAPKVAMSRGSACGGIEQAPSHVLLAMGLQKKEAFRTIRISLGRFTTNEMVHEASEALIKRIMEEDSSPGTQLNKLQKNRS